MGFKKLRIAPITSRVSDDKFPVYGDFVKLQKVESDAEELNSIEITINNIKKSRVYNADDREEEKEVNVRYEGTLKVYDCDADVALGLFGYRKDANSNTIEVMNSRDKKSFGMFFQGKTSKDIEFQKYLYDIAFGEPEITNTTDNGEDIATLEIPFKGNYIYTDGEVIRSATVHKGNMGWVSGEPIAMYKPVKAATPPV